LADAGEEPGFPRGRRAPRNLAGGQAGAQAGAVTAWDVSVRFDDGIDRVIRVYQTPSVRPGMKVRVANGSVQPL
jgi:hypothetical protein